MLGMLQSTNYQCDLDIVVLRKAGDAHGHKTVVVDSCGFVFACVFGVVLRVVLLLLLDFGRRTCYIDLH